MIGLSLGLIDNQEFVPFVIALSFHQFFEGLAISSLVSEHFYHDKIKTMSMIALYTLSTPIGTAIGILVRETFNANSADTLVSMIVLECFTGGLVIYESLSAIMIPFCQSHSPAWVKVTSLLSLWLGGLVMSVIGIWA